MFQFYLQDNCTAGYCAGTKNDDNLAHLNLSPFSHASKKEDCEEID